MNTLAQAARRRLRHRPVVRLLAAMSGGSGLLSLPHSGRVVRRAAVLSLLGMLGMLAGCVAMPTGPSWLALPGTGRSPEQFRIDDAACRGAASTGGASPGAQAQADQYSYDQVYLQCMYMKGHRVPVDASVGQGQPPAGSPVSGAVVPPGTDSSRSAGPRRAAPAPPAGIPPNPPRSWTGG